jgi:hypothetical protein
MRTEATTVKTKARVLFSKHCARTRHYDAIPSTDDGHPVDLAVQRWLPQEFEQRRTLCLQDRILAALAPDAQRAFLELEELRNAVASEREEACFDLGVGYGIERERRRQHLHRFGRSREGVLALLECATALVELRAAERKSR